MNTGRFQLVWWWPAWQGVGLLRPTDSLRVIYQWHLVLGFVEVRRWAENLGRQCRAVEIAPPFVAVALQRYLDAFEIRGEMIH